MIVTIGRFNCFTDNRRIAGGLFLFYRGGTALDGTFFALFDKETEQVCKFRINTIQVFRMELHAHDKAVAGSLNCFNDPVRCGGHCFEAVSKLFDRLVVE